MVKKNVKINKWKVLKYILFLHPNIMVFDTSIKLPSPSDLKFLGFMVTQKKMYKNQRFWQPAWFKQYLFMINLHIQYIIFYGTWFDKKLKAYIHHLLKPLLYMEN